MIRFTHLGRRIRSIARNVSCFVLMMASGFFSSVGVSASEPVITGRTTVKISDVGVSDVNISLKTQINYYTALKQMGGNFNLLARQIGMDDRNWTNLNELSGKFIDNNNEVKMTFQTPGAARNVKANQWVVRMFSAKGCQLVSAAGSHVTLMSAESTDIGLGTMVIDIELPAGATNATYDSQRSEITYEFTPEVTNGTKPELQFEVDHKTTLMSSIAKNYSNPTFNYMWAARATAVNTGDQVLSNYRVRFRVAEMGSWGSWQRVSKLYPGQTVVDPFFPIFDLEKMMALNGSRPAVIEVEYEYLQPDGVKVEETDSFPVQILSRNEVIFSSLKPEEITGFVDQFDYAPALFTSMTTPADPVVQQLAGRINGMAAESYGQSIAASSSDDECVAFMSAMHHFLQTNHVAYQSPPGMLTQGNQGQHIKYTRDVLRNRAGTCVDLAVTWASVCEAVGLEPAIILVPGHAFPAVKLPKSQQWLAIESTMLNATFKDAVTKGNEELAEALKGQHYLVDITEVRKLGVLGLDLPNASEDYLTNLGYSFVAQKFEQPENETPVGNATEPINQENNQTPTEPVQETEESGADATTEPTISNIIGKWGGYTTIENNNVWIGLSIDSNGRYEFLIQTFLADESSSQSTFQGGWGISDSNVVFEADNGNILSFPCEVTSNQLKLINDDGSSPLVLDRIEG